MIMYLGPVNLVAAGFLSAPGVTLASSAADGNAIARTPATPVGNGVSSSTRSAFFTARANTRRYFDPTH